MKQLLLTLLLLLAPLRVASAQANAGQVAIAGGTTLGLELGGAVGGGLLGLAIAGRACNPEDEGTCPESALLGVVAGVGLGYMGGGLGGAALGANIVGARPARTVGFAAMGLGGQILLSFATSQAGGAGEWLPFVGLLGMPAGASIAVATDQTVSGTRYDSLVLSPVVQRGGGGLLLRGRF